MVVLYLASSLKEFSVGVSSEIALLFILDTR